MHRDYLPISSISFLGTCETKFLESVLGKQKVTTLMKIGKEKHEELTEGLPVIKRDDIFQNIKSGKSCIVREISVKDEVLKIIGRIDELQFIDGFINNKRTATLIDDKYPRIIYDTLPIYYKLQLASYSAAIHNSTDFSKICIVTKAMLQCRNSNHSILKKFEVQKKELAEWEYNVPKAVDIAWEIFRNKKEPEHRRFNVSEGEWLDCLCNKIEW